MKKLICALAVILFLGIYTSEAQVYTGTVGMGLEVGDGETQVGVAGKYFFSQHHSAIGELLFGDITAVNLLYGYHGGFEGAPNLQWFAGGGLSFLFGDSDTDVGLRPLVGLDYKLNDVPLAFSFDWRPYISFDQGSESARFGIGIRYVWD